MTNNALAAALIAVLAVLPGNAAWAQTEASKPAGMKLEQGKSDAAAAADKPLKTASATGRRPTRINEDARHCLDLPTTAEIVRCAEPYRY